MIALSPIEARQRVGELLEAIQAASVAGLQSSLLDKAEIAALREQVERAARFTVGVTDARTLNDIAGNILDVTSGETSIADARRWISSLTDDQGYELGQSRAELIVDTLTKTAQGYIKKKHDYSPDMVELFPGWELYRADERKQPRNWPERWTVSCQDAGDEDALRIFNETGRMVALKESGVWDSLGNSELWDDALDVSYPPFYFNSGVFGIDNLSLIECRELGLLAPDESPDPDAATFDEEFGENISAEIELVPAVADVITKALSGVAKLVNGRLVPA